MRRMISESKSPKSSAIRQVDNSPSLQALSTASTYITVGTQAAINSAGGAVTDIVSSTAVADNITDGGTITNVTSSTASAVNIAATQSSILAVGGPGTMITGNLNLATAQAVTNAICGRVNCTHTASQQCPVCNLDFCEACIIDAVHGCRPRRVGTTDSKLLEPNTDNDDSDDDRQDANNRPPLNTANSNQNLIVGTTTNSTGTTSSLGSTNPISRNSLALEELDDEYEAAEIYHSYCLDLQTKLKNDISLKGRHALYNAFLILITKRENIFSKMDPLSYLWDPKYNDRTDSIRVMAIAANYNILFYNKSPEEVEQTFKDKMSQYEAVLARGDLSVSEAFLNELEAMESVFVEETYAPIPFQSFPSQPFQ
jgi:hypothetical protein